MHTPGRCPIRRVLTVALLGTSWLAVSGCQTTVGNYFANRGRDLSDCFLLQVGVGPGLGVSAKAGGLAHVSLIGGAYFSELSVGLVYGELRPAEIASYFGHASGEADLGLALVHGGIHPYGDAHSQHFCFGVLPALLSFDGELALQNWIWRMRADRTRDHRLHLFDIEVGVHLFLVGARTGFSPGEFLDFLLGWFGVDIAGDDRPLDSTVDAHPESPPSPATDQGVASPPPGDQDDGPR